MNEAVRTIRILTKAAFAGAAAVHCAIQAAKELDAGETETAERLARVSLASLDEAESAITGKNGISR